MNNKYNDIIDSLQTLKAMTVDEAFREHMEQTVLPNRISSHFLLQLSAIRIALVLLAALFIGSGGMVIASANSRPGGLLYPFKEAVTAVTNPFVSKPTQKKMENKVAISPTILSTITPTPTIENMQPQSTSNNQTENTTEIKSTPTPSVATNPAVTVTQPTHTAPVSANIQINNTPVNANITVGSNPPSGSGNNAGSKDNSPNAEGRTSLLPNVNVNTPIVNIGL
jgi:hypothetical protein